jgi:hypothetical protein
MDGLIQTRTKDELVETVKLGPVVTQSITKVEKISLWNHGKQQYNKKHRHKTR